MLLGGFGRGWMILRIALAAGFSGARGFFDSSDPQGQAHPSRGGERSRMCSRAFSGDVWSR